MEPVKQALDLIRARVTNGESLADAARKVNIVYPRLCLEAMEIIGSWPASEPETRALQRAFYGT